ncbi:uncharacterized protein JN550_012479 [Neoarthrinium moseri]|uniref:uncharacterized protein n=1 Tax=Neoarthrinium moseri TaxID=1658444 RepID=UPI001FDE6ACF|nr:uncharacterized protein JN550_012479 [Neoarthrinium moseri]KAI1858729.1 hypothetical protein JN550_012479 [Neoarthrinium moseri]
MSSKIPESNLRLESGRVSHWSSDCDVAGAIENAARSQLDTPADQRAALLAVEKAIRESDVIKDSSTIDLYDWACTGLGEDYSKTIGALRLSFVKSAWKPGNANQEAFKSFYACVANGDWENAQKIAAIMDQKLPSESRPHFSNILAYYVLSSRLPVTDPRKAMFRTLAQRLTEKAYGLRDNTPNSKDYPPRAIATEEEMRLWLKIQVETRQSDSEARAFLDKPECNALKHLSEGHVSVFKEIMSLLEQHQVWEALFHISQELFDRGLEYLIEAQSSTESEPDSMTDSERKKHEAMKVIQEFTASRSEELSEVKKAAEARAFRSAVMDWSLWKQFIGAAVQLQDHKRALKQLQNFVTKVSKSAKLPSIYKKQMELANLLILFGRSQSNTSTSDENISESRINYLVAFVVANYNLVSCFDDLKPYLEQLSFDETKVFLERIGQEGEKETNDTFQNLMLLTLRLRFRYLFTSSPKSLSTSAGDASSRCNFCQNIVQDGPCFSNRDLRARIDSEDVDPFADMTIIGTTCLLKMAGFGDERRGSTMESINLKLVLWALSWLNAKYSRTPQKNQALPVFMAKLYLLVGCVPHAKMLWDTLGVKNVTLDSLGPLFSDRLSTIAPGMWRPTGSTPMYPYHKHYMDAIRQNIPRNIRTSLELGNFTSTLGLLAFQDRLTHSCTMIVSNVEDRRGIRAVGGKPGFDAKDDPLLRLIDNQKEFVNVTDNAALPNHECDPATLADIISIGPGLSDTRAKLSLFTEQFISLISYKEPKDFKPIKPAQVAELERSYIAQTAQSIHMNFATPFLRCLDAATDNETVPVLTDSEFHYFTTINFLLSHAVLATERQWNKSAPRDKRGSTIVGKIAAQIKYQTTSLALVREDTPETARALCHFSNLHALGMLRESALAVKLTAGFLERLIAPAKNDAPKWLADDVKALQSAATEANDFVKKRIKALSDAANTSGSLDSISEYAFGGLIDGSKSVNATPATAADGELETMIFVAAGQHAGFENTIGEILDSWQEVAKGWNTVKLD